MAYSYFEIESRRYIGNKAKLTDWIMQTLAEQTQNAHTFCDIFAGTGVVTKAALPHYDHFIMNDFLCSNHIIFEAFFGIGEWDEVKLQAYIDDYNTLKADAIEDNYFSINFGDKYYDMATAKRIGYIRQHIEDNRAEFTPKEYAILLTSLIYTIDRLANTCGHFDAYIKKPIRVQTFTMRLIHAQSLPQVQIYQEDANVLAPQIEADIVYLDPPYNSRQYSNAYHLIENLVRWEMPQLEGVSMKFRQPEKQSKYCSRMANEVFEELVESLNTHYIVLSYNNMAKKGNARSNACITDEEIMRILANRGKVKVFEQPHKVFSAGRTEINDNKERLFICEI